VEHIDLATGFITHLSHVAHFFLLPKAKKDLPVPTKKDAEQVMKIMEPVAKDGAAQFIMQVYGDIYGDLHINPPPPIVGARYNSQEANAIQNAARRYLGPQLPTTRVHDDEILTLFQMRADPNSQVGDRGVIETISPKPMKPAFSRDDVKRKIVDQEDNPFQRAFLVDAEIKTADGKPKLYRILDYLALYNLV
jgi:hypothetical protein